MLVAAPSKRKKPSLVIHATEPQFSATIVCRPAIAAITIAANAKVITTTIDVDRTVIVKATLTNVHLASVDDQDVKDTFVKCVTP